MSKSAKWLCLIHAAVALVFGAALWLVPGRFETWIKWGGSDIVLSRLFGAALLGMAWASFRSWRAPDWSQVAIYVELGAAFDTLACAGLIWSLARGFASKPLIWVLLVLFVAFAAAWIAVLVTHMRKH